MAFGNADALNRITAAMRRWSAVCNVRFVYMGETSAPFTVINRSLDNINVIGWDLGNNLVGEVAGLTELAWDTSTTIRVNGQDRFPILETEIRLNHEYLSQVSAEDFDTTITHEIGHALGLKHSDKPLQLMSGPSVDAGIASTAFTYFNAPQSDDVAGCVALYGRAAGNASAGNYQDVWWGGASENGWGLNLVQHGSTLVGGWYLFGPDGQPTFYIMQGGSWDLGFTTFTGPLIQPVSSAPFSNYDASRFNAGPQAGTLSISFIDSGNAVLNYVINGVTGNKTISRLPYGSGSSVGGYADVWWGGAEQNGWGIAIAQQGNTLVAGWYTFGLDGKPTWYVLNGGSWISPTAYRGSLISGTGAPVIGAMYDPSLFRPRVAGTLTLTFSDANNAIMSYDVDGVVQSKPITRLPF